MNRKNFLARLIALPIGLIAAVKAAEKPKPARFVWFVDWKDITLPPVREGCACSLTCASTQPLTPVDFEEMANTEYKLAKTLEGSRRA